MAVDFAFEYMHILSCNILNRKNQAARSDLQDFPTPLSSFRAKVGLAQAKAAKEEKEDLLEKIEIAGVHSRNSLYLLFIAVSSFGFLAYVIKTKKVSTEGVMNYSERFGISTMIVSVLVIALALFISDGWGDHLDFLQSLMLTLRIRLFEGEGALYTKTFLIDVPTKYVVWTFLCTTAYGLTTYFGITPAFWKPASGAEAAAKEAT